MIDICPVGALTEQDFRFKARVWYLSSAPSVCNGCAQGCNVDVHYVLDRPHLNDGARVMRLKPRYNPDVNQWWMCDEGRFGFHWIDRGRLTHVRHRGTESTWEQALAAISAALATVPVRTDIATVGPARAGPTRSASSPPRGSATRSCSSSGKSSSADWAPA